MLKDFYRILELEPRASLQEIKKNFRRLAMRYHPDKHGEDQVASAHFREIQEAYDTLTDPVKREVYFQQRWYQQVIGRKLTGGRPETAQTLLQDVLRLEKYIAGLDPYRIDREGLLQYQLYLLEEKSLAILHQQNDPEINRQITVLLLRSAAGFRKPEAEILVQRLQLINPDDPEIQQVIRSFLKRKRNEYLWESCKFPFFLFITILICLVIYFLAR
jgi:curved DNA-binding protein CbpA